MTVGVRMYDIDVGIDPLRKFCRISKVLSCFKFRIDGGRVPVSWLPNKTKLRTRTRFPISSGSSPAMGLLATLISSRDEMLHMNLKLSDPETTDVFWRRRSLSDRSDPNVGGKGPTKPGEKERSNVRRL